jgi:hypothetical protein
MGTKILTRLEAQLEGMRIHLLQSTDPLLLLAWPRQFGANIARDSMSGVENHDRPRIV